MLERGRELALQRGRRLYEPAVRFLHDLACDTDADCDSIRCVGKPLSFTGNICSARAPGDPCDTNADCDSNICVGQHLTQPHDSICEDGQAGQLCDDDTDCVQGTCNGTCQL